MEARVAAAWQTLDGEEREGERERERYTEHGEELSDPQVPRHDTTLIDESWPCRATRVGPKQSHGPTNKLGLLLFQAPRSNTPDHQLVTCSQCCRAHLLRVRWSRPRWFPDHSPARTDHPGPNLQRRTQPLLARPPGQALQKAIDAVVRAEHLQDSVVRVRASHVPRGEVPGGVLSSGLCHAAGAEVVGEELRPPQILGYHEVCHDAVSVGEFHVPSAGKPTVPLVEMRQKKLPGLFPISDKPGPCQRKARQLIRV